MSVAEATGGDAVRRGGDAAATASSSAATIANATADATAHAAAGEGTTGGQAEAHADSTAHRASATAVAASGSMGAIRRWVATATGVGEGTVQVSARSGQHSAPAAPPGAPLPAQIASDITTMLVAEPSGDVAADAVSGNPTIVSELAAAGADFFLAFGTFEVTRTQGVSAAPILYSARADLSLVASSSLDAWSSLRIGTFNAQSTVTGASSLAFRIFNEDQLLVELSGMDPLGTSMELDDAVFDLGSSVIDLDGDGLLELSLFLDVAVSEAGQGAQLDFVIASAAPVPLPGPAGLLLVGLGVVVRRRQISRRV